MDHSPPHPTPDSVLTPTPLQGPFSPQPHSRLHFHPDPTLGSILTAAPLRALFSPLPHSGLHSHPYPRLRSHPYPTPGSVLTPTPFRAPFSPLPLSGLHSHPNPPILTPSTTNTFVHLSSHLSSRQSSYPSPFLSVSPVFLLSVCRGSVLTIPKSIFVCFTYLLSVCRGSVFTIPLALYWHLSHSVSQVSSISDDNNHLCSVLDKHAPLCRCTVRTRKPTPWFSSIVEQFCELKRERWQAERR